MNQDEFRRLLDKPSAFKQSSASGSASTKPKAATTSSNEPAFKPRKVKKKPDEGRYRDRAAERRTGGASDFAEVEAVLAEFEQRAADAEDRDVVERQRAYLGGDAAHTVLVKGLDYSLLEANRAREAKVTGVEDDEALEQAFAEGSTAAASQSDTAGKPVKKSKEEILQAIKVKRANKNADSVKEKEEKTLNFKPIGTGFKPIGSGFQPIGVPQDTKKKKKKKAKDKEPAAVPKDRQQEKRAPVAKEASSSISAPANLPQEDSMEVEPLDDDFNIFADAGEYEGIEDISDNEDDGDQPATVPSNHQQNRGGGWFGDADSTFEDRTKATAEPEETMPPSVGNNSTTSYSVQEQEKTPEKPDDDEETGIPTRLAPLASSAMPSIRDLLDADKAAAKSHRKRKKRKGNTEGDDEDGGDSNSKEKMSAETRAERDYKRLKSFTQKKGGA